MFTLCKTASWRKSIKKKKDKPQSCPVISSPSCSTAQEITTHCDFTLCCCATAVKSHFWKTHINQNHSPDAKATLSGHLFDLTQLTSSSMRALPSVPQFSLPSRMGEKESRLKGTAWHKQSRHFGFVVLRSNVKNTWTVSSRHLGFLAACS